MKRVADDRERRIVFADGLRSDGQDGCLKIDIKTRGVHHILLRSANLGLSRHFYLETLGFPPVLAEEDIFLFRAGGTVVGVRGPEERTPEADVFDPFRVGLDHMALACDEEEELVRVADALTQAGVENTGIKLDETLNQKYVAFKDPDGIKWELYMATEQRP